MRRGRDARSVQIQRKMSCEEMASRQLSAGQRREVSPQIDAAATLT